MSFQQLDNNVKALATAVGQKLAELHVKIGAGSLASEFNDNNVKDIIAALNHLATKIAQVQAAAGASINDTSKSATTTYSSNKIEALLQSVTDKLDKIGTLSDLTKGGDNLVQAINKVVEYVDSKDTGVDTKIASKVTAEIAKLVGGAPESLDTLKEIADWITSNEAAVQAINGKVSFKQAQSLTDEEKKQVWSNIGLGSTETDYAKVFKDSFDAALASP